MQFLRKHGWLIVLGLALLLALHLGPGFFIDPAGRNAAFAALTVRFLDALSLNVLVSLVVLAVLGYLLSRPAAVAFLRERLWLCFVGAPLLLFLVPGFFIDPVGTKAALAALTVRFLNALGSNVLLSAAGLAALVLLLSSEPAVSLRREHPRLSFAGGALLVLLVPGVFIDGAGAKAAFVALTARFLGALSVKLLLGIGFVALAVRLYASISAANAPSESTLWFTRHWGGLGAGEGGWEVDPAAIRSALAIVAMLALAATGAALILKDTQGGADGAAPSPSGSASAKPAASAAASASPDAGAP